jgi:ComF family protein
VFHRLKPSVVRDKRKGVFMAFDGAQMAFKRLFLSRLASGLHIAADGVSELLWPTRCVLCDAPGTLLCEKCRFEIPFINPLEACPYCGQAYGRNACLDCNTFIVKHRGFSSKGQHSNSSESEQGMGSVRWPLDQIVSVFEFREASRNLITVYKDRKEIRLAPILAGMLYNYLNPEWLNSLQEPNGVGLVVIPARKQALRERGFDHMHEIGVQLSKLSGLPLLDLLLVNERADQRALSAQNRQKNMANSFLINPCSTDVCQTVILVDDVLTTGSTLIAAAATLKKAGIKKVYGLTLGRIP